MIYWIIFIYIYTVRPRNMAWMSKTIKIQRSCRFQTTIVSIHVKFPGCVYECIYIYLYIRIVYYVKHLMLTYLMRRFLYQTSFQGEVVRGGSSLPKQKIMGRERSLIWEVNIPLSQNSPNPFSQIFHVFFSNEHVYYFEVGVSEKQTSMKQTSNFKYDLGPLTPPTPPWVSCDAWNRGSQVLSFHPIS